MVVIVLIIIRNYYGMMGGWLDLFKLGDGRKAEGGKGIN